MTFKNSHKALAITFLITGTLALSILNVVVFKLNTSLAETVYEIEKIENLDLEKEQEIEQQNQSKSTNKAYNKTEKYKHNAQAYKPIAPPKDFDDPRLKTYKSSNTKTNNASKNEASSAISNKTLTSFNEINSILNKRSQKQESTQSNTANTNSSIYYSLKGRMDKSLPIPVYLCNASGKIVVNITVNQNGTVVATSINSSSTSSNACLLDHALEYAKEARFDSASKNRQIGTITFVFRGK